MKETAEIILKELTHNRNLDKSVLNLINIDFISYFLIKYPNISNVKLLFSINSKLLFFSKKDWKSLTKKLGNSENGHYNLIFFLIHYTNVDVDFIYDIGLNTNYFLRDKTNFKDVFESIKENTVLINTRLGNGLMEQFNVDKKTMYQIGIYTL